MHKRTPPRPCIVPDCKQRAAYQFLAIDGDQAHKLTRENGARIRACTRHLDHVTRRCADLAALPIRAVPIGAAAVIPIPPELAAAPPTVAGRPVWDDGGP